jgi:peptidoglycan hydrolase-like protein with peptidoglycan-binding domain
MHRTTKGLSLRSSEEQATSSRPRWARRTRLLVTALAAFSTVGLLVPAAASAETRPALPSVRIVLPPVAVRATLPPHAVSKPAASVPKTATKTTGKVAPQTATRVVATTPRPGATGVALGERITIKLSAPPAPGAAMPTLQPPVAGKWWKDAQTLTFVPAIGFSPWATEHVVVKPPLAAASKWSFDVSPVPVLRAQQLLAELGYLPLNVDVVKGQPLLAEEPTRAALVPSAPRPGYFTWRYPSSPLSLKALWSPDQYTVMTQGAVMSFEAAVGLPTDGVISPPVWAALTAAVAGRHIDRSSYNYLVVSESLPESLVVWQGGREVYETPVNTGVPGATTPIGTWPVYARYLTTTMSGTDPDGYQYDVSGVPFVAYFVGGDAVHGYWRSYYGYPQSNGCVELPIANSQVVWSLDPIGTLVTVVY